MKWKYIVIVLMLSAVVFFALQNPYLQPMFSTKKGPRPDFSFENVTFSELNNGQKSWEMKAESAQLFKKNKLTQLKNIKGVIYSGDTKAAVSWTSPSANFNLDSNRLHASSCNATFLTQGHTYHFQSDQLSWNAKDRVLVGSGQIQVHGDRLTVWGDTLYADLDTLQIAISSNAKARIEPE